jgi:hypothetical protein
MTELEQLQAIRALLETVLDPAGFQLGFGTGITLAGGWLLVSFFIQIFNESDE